MAPPNWNAGDQVHDVESDRDGLIYAVRSNTGVDIIFPDAGPDAPEFTKHYTWPQLEADPAPIVKIG